MARITSNPITDIRDIVREHEEDHTGGTMVILPPCKCMERIGYIMQVFYPEGAEYQFEDTDDLEEFLESERDGDE